MPSESENFPAFPPNNSHSHRVVNSHRPFFRQSADREANVAEEASFNEGSEKHAAGWINFYWGKTPDELRRSKTISDAMTLGWLELYEKKAKTLENELNDFLHHSR